MASPKVVDTLIIGGGPAGLAAALVYARTRTTAIVFDSSAYRNEGIKHMHTVPSRDHMDPYEFRSIAREQVTSRYPTVRFEKATITHAAAKKLDLGDGKGDYDGFEVVDSEGMTYEGKKLILATGSCDIFPSIEGFRENWPSHIYQCLACDGFEQAGTPIGVLDCSPKTAHFVNMALNFDPRVTVLTNGVVSQDPVVKQQMRICEAWGAAVETRKITCLVNNGPSHEEGVTVVFEEGEPLMLGFIAHKPTTVNRAKDLIQQLGLECVDEGMGGHVKIFNPMFNSTSVRGVFVSGDTMTPMKQVTVAMADGVKAAAGAGVEMAAEREMATIKALEEEDLGGKRNGCVPEEPVPKADAMLGSGGNNVGK